MKKFVLEYGRLIIAIIAIIGFFILLGGVLNKNSSDPKSIYGIFETQGQDSSAVYNEDFYTSVVGDVVENSTAPYFSIADGSSFVIDKNQLTYDQLFKNVRIMYDGSDITGSSSVNGQPVETFLIIYEYKPSIVEAEGTDRNGYLEMEEVDALDKYGHYIYQDASGKYNNEAGYDESTGKKVKVMQPKFNVSKGCEFASNSYVDLTPESDVDNARRYKVVYRVQVGTLKAECMVTYIKNQEGEDINASGKSKINFQYD